VTVDDASYVVLPVGSGTRAALLVSSPASDGTTPDLTLLQHVATIADVEVERRAALEVRKRVRGTRILQQLVDGTVTPEYALGELAELDLSEGPWRVILWSSSSHIGDLEELLFDAGVPMLHLRGEHGHLVFVASRTPDDAFASPVLMAHAHSGASRLVHNLARVPDSVREARWAMEVASDTPGRRVVYGERTAPFFPRSMAEAEEVVAQILGALLAYDLTHDSELVRSLEVFFETNRSWQEGARQLGIHRQTLVYRMRRIEQLTERDLSKFGDQAELYFAVRTWRMLQPS
jgi:purine catabolism regulator